MIENKATKILTDTSGSLGGAQPEQTRSLGFRRITEEEANKLRGGK